MIGDLVAVNLHELGKPLHILNHLNPILFERSHGRDKAIPEALYNYIIIARGAGRGVHNPVYVQELLYDSIVTMTGAAPVSIPTRP